MPRGKSMEIKLINHFHHVKYLKVKYIRKLKEKHR